MKTKFKNLPTHDIFFFASLEEVAQRCSVKKVFLEIRKIQENTSARVCNFIKKETLS